MANQRTDSKGTGTLKVTLLKSPIGFNRAQGDRIVLSPNINGTGIATGAQALAFASMPPGFEGSTLITLGGGLIVVVGVPQLFATDFVIG